NCKGVVAMASDRRAHVLPEARHAKPADPAVTSPEASAEVQPATQTDGHRLQHLESEVRDLAAKVDSLEQTAVPPPSPSDPAAMLEGAPRRPAVPAAPQTPGEKEPATPQARLQEVLPKVKDLAQQVGGMEQLAQIIETLKQSKE